MTRPVRPVALVILTLCMVYPGVTLLFQGLYPFVAGEHFTLVSQLDPWLGWGARLGVPGAAVELFKAFLGLLWLLAVPGLWAGDARAWPLTVAAAALSVLHPGGSMVMGALALVCLFGFREDAAQVPA